MPTAVWATITPMVGRASFTRVETIGPSSIAVRARTLRSAPESLAGLGGATDRGSSSVASRV